MAKQATPSKLRDGSWGARVAGSVAIGDVVTITTRGGKSWDATVSRVLWTDGRVALVATSGSRSGADSQGYSIRSGASYRRGITAPRGRVCPECGSRECPKAWSPHDLCEND